MRRELLEERLIYQRSKKRFLIINYLHKQIAASLDHLKRVFEGNFRGVPMAEQREVCRSGLKGVLNEDFTRDNSNRKVGD